MRRAFLIACVVALLLAATAPATSVKVQVTQGGFSPAHVTLAAGDSISWVATGSGDHRLACKTCRFRSNRLQEHDSYGFTFLRPGTFTVTDELNGNKKATITVRKAPASVNVTASSSTLPYGSAATVSGTVSSRKAGTGVEILAQQCIAPQIKVVATVKSAKGGVFVYHTRPSQITSFHARYAAPSGTVVSPTVRIGVAPLVTLKKLAPGKFSIRVAAAKPFVGKPVMFQRFAPKQHRWLTSKVALLDRQSHSTAPLKNTSVSSVVVASKLAKGTKLRAVLRSFQALPCYTTAWSKTTAA